MTFYPDTSFWTWWVYQGWEGNCFVQHADSESYKMVLADGVFPHSWKPYLLLTGVTQGPWPQTWAAALCEDHRESAIIVQTCWECNKTYWVLMGPCNTVGGKWLWKLCNHNLQSLYISVIKLIDCAQSSQSETSVILPKYTMQMNLLCHGSRLWFCLQPNFLLVYGFTNYKCLNLEFLPPGWYLHVTE